MILKHGELRCVSFARTVSYAVSRLVLACEGGVDCCFRMCVCEHEPEAVQRHKVAGTISKRW